MITLSFDYAVPVLIGRGLTLESARTKLNEAKVKGNASALTNGGFISIPIEYAGGKFTIGQPR